MNINQIKVLFGAMTLLSCQYVLAQDSDTRWWQRETLQPSTRQVINPRYVTKKRELEKSWDEYQNNIRAEKHFRSMGQKTNALRGAVRESERVIGQIQHELESIRPYVTTIRERSFISGQATPLDISVILNTPKRSSPRSTGLPSSTIPPSQWYDRVVDELLNLLPEDSPKATKRIRFALLLVPEDYDYTKDRIIIKGVERVLKSEIANILDSIRFPSKKPVELILGTGGVTCIRVNKASTGTGYWLGLQVPGTSIVFDDGSSYEPRWTYRYYTIERRGYTGLYWDVGGNSPNPSNVNSQIIQKKASYRERWRTKTLEDAKEKYEKEKEIYEKWLKAFAEKKDEIVRAGQLLDQLWALSGDSKWIADKTRIHNDMVRVLEREGYLEKQKLSGGDLKTKK